MDYPGLVASYGYAAFIVFNRFMYGLRLVGPVAIGMSAVTWPRFAILNAIGAALVAVPVVRRWLSRRRARRAGASDGS